ncbi:MAG TPA: Clp protease N-terminal domain-containing protein [Chloroflexota bacterium]|nr:Clp protease N-terminal domain-containing protein [Chloroflexota bacterium]
MSDRFDKFTERAKKVLVLAQEEAKRLNHNYIGTEHLLIGLMAEGQGVGARILAGAGIDQPRLREALAMMVGRGDTEVTGPISLTPRAKRVVELAVEESRALGHTYVGTEHLLLGLANTRDEKVGNGISVAVLVRCGVDPDALREETLKAIASENERLLGVSSGGTIVPVAGARSRDNVVTCRVDDLTLNALDSLVEAGVHTTRSEAAARLILAGIQANQELFKKVQAAVAEIRRVREETQALVRMWEAGEADKATEATEATDVPAPRKAGKDAARSKARKAPRGR